MRILFLIFACVALTAGAPRVRKPNKLHFRNLYRTPIAEPKKKISPHIIGGQEAEPHSIPYQAFLEIYTIFEGWYCGGALISENYVLTAAHCGKHGWQAYVTLGAHDVYNIEDSQVTVYTGDIIIHAEYDSKTVTNDIALIGLEGGVTLNEVINVVTLPTAEDASNTYDGVSARISGWGLTSDNATDVSQFLNYVDVTVISKADCEAVYGELPDSQICTSGDGIVGSCGGDSGGPLVADGVLIGIISYGAEFCEGGFPSGFTRVTSYLDWIASNTEVQIK